LYQVSGINYNTNIYKRGVFCKVMVASLSCKGHLKKEGRSLNSQEKRLEELKEFQGKIGYFFKDIKLLNAALTHSSYANENGLSVCDYNERLEFLGDAVLEIVTSEYFYVQFPDYPEGMLTKIRAKVVQGKILAEYAAGISIGKFVLLGKGEESSGGRNRVSILADTFEAVAGAIYLDGGYLPARDFVLKFIVEEITDVGENNRYHDYKTYLQEKIQSQTGQSIEYRLVDECGPDHDKTFFIQVFIDDKIYGEGVGKSKKEAQQNAAREALEKLVK